MDTVAQKSLEIERVLEAIQKKRQILVDEVGGTSEPLSSKINEFLDLQSDAQEAEEVRRHWRSLQERASRAALSLEAIQLRLLYSLEYGQRFVASLAQVSSEPNCYGKDRQGERQLRGNFVRKSC